VGRVTIADVANRAGVSPAAVSFALNGRVGVSEPTRQRILAVAAEMGWRPSSAARSLSSAKTDTIGLVLARDPGILGVESFYMQFIAGIEIELERRSVGLLLQVVPSLAAEMAQYEAWQASRRVDGVVATDLRIDDPRVGLLQRPTALPAVLVGDTSLAGGLTNVWTDDATATRTLVRHLWSQGHRRFVRVAGPPEYGHTRIRDDAFRQEIRRLGAHGFIQPTDYSPEQGDVVVPLSGARVVLANGTASDRLAVRGVGEYRATAYHPTGHPAGTKTLHLAPDGEGVGVLRVPPGGLVVLDCAEVES